jgi:VanZ family protein
LWAILIFILSSISLPPEPEIPYLDKLVHFVEYGLLSYLLARALKKSASKLSLINIFFLAVIITLLYGITDEVHQSFVPNRTYDIHDIVADGVGGLAGAWVYFKHRVLL